MMIQETKEIHLNNSFSAFSHLHPLMTAPVEEVWCIALNSIKIPLATARIFRGTVDGCLFHPRDILRFAILNNASSFIIAHNHPSGDPRPSESDIKNTRRLKSASKIIGIKLVDHIIVVSDRYFSFCDAGKLR